MTHRALLLAFPALLTACSAMNQIGEETGRSAGIGNAIVIEDESLESSRGSVISILQTNVRGMSVSRTEICPHIVLRGGSRTQTSEVLVYLDGQRISDTCILDALDADALARVEVYPSGVTQRPGYRSNNGGLILVFTKNGSEARLWE
jgi:hypothetical protein